MSDQAGKPTLLPIYRKFPAHMELTGQSLWVRYLKHKATYSCRDILLVRIALGDKTMTFSNVLLGPTGFQPKAIILRLSPWDITRMLRLVLDPTRYNP